MADENIESIIITDLNGGEFCPGDIIKASIEVWCYSTTNDFLDISYSPMSPLTWKTQNTQQCTSANSFNTLAHTFQLDWLYGSHIVRGSWRYNGISSSCATEAYDDNDDVVFEVVWSDTDSDGISNCDEASIGTNPNNPDSDGDLFDDGTEYYAAYTDPLNSASYPSPLVTTVSPNWVIPGDTSVILYIYGSYFLDGATVSFSGSDITLLSTQYFGSYLKVTMNVDPSAIVGPIDVTVTNPVPSPGSDTLVGGVTVTSLPLIERVYPALLLAPGLGLDFTIEGKNFQATPTVNIVGEGVDITVNSVTFIDSNTIQVNVDIAANAAPGFRDLTVTNPDLGSNSGKNLFYVYTNYFTINMDTLPSYYSNDMEDGRDNVLGDIDLDGDLDLIVGSDYIIALYDNIGGTFSLTASWYYWIHGRKLALGDIDGDGDLDLVTAADTSGLAIFFNNNGDLGANPVYTSDLGDDGSAVALGDMDLDGDLDIAVGYDPGPVRIYLNGGGGSFSDADTIETHGGMGTALGPNAFADRGNLYYAAETVLLTESEFYLQNLVAPANVHFFVYESDIPMPAGNYTKVFETTMPAVINLPFLGFVSSGPIKVWLKQGKFYYIGAKWNSGLITFREGMSPPVSFGYIITGIPNPLTGPIVPSPNSITQPYVGGVETYYQRLTTSRVWESDETTYHTYSLAWGDIDNNGWLDLAVGNLGVPLGLAEENLIYFNYNGLLEATASWVSLEANKTSTILLGDLNGDGSLDMVEVNEENEVWNVFENTGGGLNTLPDYSSVQTYYGKDGQLGDLDNDGDLNLIIAGTDWNVETDYIFLNELGSLSAFSAWQAADADFTYSVALGDIDIDGDLDIVMTNMFQPDKTYINNSNTIGSQPYWQSTELVGNVRTEAWGDVDNDGDVDLVVGLALGGERLYKTVNGYLETTAS